MLSLHALSMQQVNFVFSTLSLLESCVILSLAFHDKEFFLPRRVVLTARALRRIVEAVGRCLTCRRTASQATPTAAEQLESLYAARPPDSAAGGATPPPSPPPPSGPAEMPTKTTTTEPVGGREGAATSEAVPERASEKLLFFENLFFKLDVSALVD